MKDPKISIIDSPLSCSIFKSKPRYSSDVLPTSGVGNPKNVAELYFNCYHTNYLNCHFLTDNSLLVDWGSTSRPSFLFVQNKNFQQLLYEKKLKLPLGSAASKKEEHNTIIEILSNSSLKDMIRYDYDTHNHTLGHPLAHIHMNYSNEFRLGVSHKWAFEDFILFIMQFYYHDEYIKIKNIQPALQLPMDKITKYKYYIRQEVR